MSRTITAAVRKEAILSPCGRYRYLLTRYFGEEGAPLTFVMLNPSTADSEHDDPTIRRCVGFARSLNYRAIRVVNLFAWRATDKSELPKLSYDKAVGPKSDDYIDAELRDSVRVVAAWGGHSGPLGQMVKDRALQVGAMCSRYRRILWCLGTAKDGHPRHPLYLPKDAQLDVWRGL